MSPPVLGRVLGTGYGLLCHWAFSEHPLSTALDTSASLWSDAVMRDVQRNVCNVIRTRSEASASRRERGGNPEREPNRVDAPGRRGRAP
jgi:hypothetical protein